MKLRRIQLQKCRLFVMLFLLSCWLNIQQHILNLFLLLIWVKSPQIFRLHFVSSHNSKVSFFKVVVTIDNNSSLVRSAIEHICFLADVNRLYDEALGLYRLDIALLIAQKSQKVSEFWGFTDDRILESICLSYEVWMKWTPNCRVSQLMITWRDILKRWSIYLSVSLKRHLMMYWLMWTNINFIMRQCDCTNTSVINMMYEPSKQY